MSQFLTIWRYLPVWLLIGSLVSTPVLGLSLEDLSREERQSIESACSGAKYGQGPAAYNRCLEQQLSSLRGAPRRPDLSDLSREERQSIESACSGAKYGQGPAAYNRCLEQQLSSLRGAPRRPDLSDLSREERQSIESACSGAKYGQGPAAYNRCLEQQLSSLRGAPRRPDLSGLSREERQSIESACSGAKYGQGPAAYNRCLQRQIDELMAYSGSITPPKAPSVKPPGSNIQTTNPTYNAEIRRAQQLLQSIGYDPGSADGHLGARTRRAIIAFQTDIGVPQTGAVDSVLLAQLDLTVRLTDDQMSRPASPTGAQTSPGSPPSRKVAMPPIQVGNTDKRLSASEVFRKGERSVFIVLAARSATALRNGKDVIQGSAVAISTTLLLTNCHVIDQLPFIVIISGNDVLPVRMVAEDSIGDRCVIEVVEGKLIPLAAYAHILTSKLVRRFLLLALR